MLKAKNKLVGKITTKNTLKGKLNNVKEKVYPSLIDLEVTPSSEEQVFNHDGSYGYDNVTVNAVKLQDKEVTPTREEQILTPDSDYTGLNQVKVTSVTKEIDSNIVADNIKNGVDILGVTGNFVGGKYAPRHISFYGARYFTELDYEISNLDTSAISNFSYMFNAAQELLSVPLFDTSNGTNFSYMFNACTSLTTIPLLNTSKGTNFSYMFQNAYDLESIPLIDTSNGTNFSSMFNGCTSLATIPLIDTSKGTNFSSMFYNTPSLESIPLLNTSKGTNFSSMLNSCRNVINVEGFKNLGQAYSTTNSANYNNYKLDLSRCTLLTHDSLMNVINNLYDIAAKGCKTQGLVLGTTNLAKLTADEIAIATNKGWTVS